jgi:predicted transposase/invertase (TIGR01784 family)
MKEGLAKGKAEGITQGIAQNKLETAHNLKKEGLPIEMISRVTGLSIEEIEALD